MRSCLSAFAQGCFDQLEDLSATGRSVCHQGASPSLSKAVFLPPLPPQSLLSKVITDYRGAAGVVGRCSVIVVVVFVGCVVVLELVDFSRAAGVLKDVGTTVFGL